MDAKRTGGVRVSDDHLVTLIETIGGLKESQDNLKKGFEDMKQVQAESVEANRETQARLAQIPFIEHNEHHDWIEERLKKEKEKAAFWRDVRLYMVQKGVWLALLAVLTLGMLLWHDSALDIVYKLFNLKAVTPAE